jgi:hypothetical protein
MEVNMMAPTTTIGKKARMKMYELNSNDNLLLIQWDLWIGTVNLAF